MNTVYACKYRTGTCRVLNNASDSVLSVIYNSADTDNTDTFINVLKYF